MLHAAVLGITGSVFKDAQAAQASLCRNVFLRPLPRPLLDYLVHLLLDAPVDLFINRLVEGTHGQIIRDHFLFVVGTFIFGFLQRFAQTLALQLFFAGQRCVFL